MALTDDKRCWLREPIREDVIDLWHLRRVRYEANTAYQHVLVADTRLGTTLFCDENPQSAEIGQLEFHEAELVPGLLLADSVEKLLVIGCSEGTVPQLAARAGVRYIDHVDIDAECLRICAEHLPYGYDLDALRRAESGTGPIRLHYDDGIRFASAALRDGARYDLVVLDLPEEDEDSGTGSNTMYGQDFFEALYALLEDGGVLSTHISRPHLSVPASDSVRSFVAPWHRLGNVFDSRMYFRSDEQPWAAVMSGRRGRGAAPLSWMLERFAALSWSPSTIDRDALLAGTRLPAALRNTAPAASSGARQARER